jgi:hypothetical protein
LKNEDSEDNNEKQGISGDPLEDVQLFVKLSGVKEVEYLHHDKCIEDECKMP